MNEIYEVSIQVYEVKSMKGLEYSRYKVDSFELDKCFFYKKDAIEFAQKISKLIDAGAIEFALTAAEALKLANESGGAVLAIKG